MASPRGRRLGVMALVPQEWQIPSHQAVIANTVPCPMTSEQQVTNASPGNPHPIHNRRFPLLSSN